MKRLAVVVTVVTLLFAGTASAKDMTGRFGLGYDATLGGASGLALTYWATNALGIDATIGFALVSTDADTMPMGFMFSLGARYNIARAKDVNLGFGLRVSLAFLNEDAHGTSTFHANIELPLIVEYFFSNHFSINLATGITLAIVPEDGAGLTSLPIGGLPNAGTAKDFGLAFGNGGLFGSAGFKFYF